MNGVTWLSSAPFNVLFDTTLLLFSFFEIKKIYCNNLWHNESNGNLVFQSASYGNEDDPNLGYYNEANFSYIAKDSIGETHVMYLIYSSFPSTFL